MQLRLVPSPRWPRQHRQQRLHVGVVSEGAAEVYVQIAIAGGEDEACSELEGIFAEAMLAVATALGANARLCVFGAQEMEQVRGF